MFKLNELARQVDQCKEEIDNRNRNNLYAFSTGAWIISAAIMVASLVLPEYQNLLISHGVLFIYICIMFVIARYCKKKRIARIRSVMYLLMAPLMLSAVVVGTIADPQKPAITILIFLCIIPLFIIDKPWHIILYQLFFGGLFVFCGYLWKDPQVYKNDMFYFPIYFAYIVGANAFILIDKIGSARNFTLVRHESAHDSLTELLNRKSGEKKVRELLKAQVHGTFAIVDLDNFKDINDRYGHQAGDEVLRQAAEAMKSVFRTSDVIWRLGGDEFAIYAVSMLDHEAYQKRFSALLQKMMEISVPSCGIIRVQVSAGCTICLSEEMNFEKIYKSSDDALYEAKNSGKGKIVFSYSR